VLVGEGYDRFGEKEIRVGGRAGFLPNFFVAYDPDALPLTARQKFELSSKSFLDPVRFGVVGIIAGVQQARNDFSGFGQP
jgi:hypothetical protein